MLPFHATAIIFVKKNVNVTIGDPDNNYFGPCYVAYKGVYAQSQFGYIKSYLDYGSMFLSSRTMENISTIQVLQNKALRSCLRIKNYVDVPTYELHLQLNVQHFDKRMQYVLLCLI